MKKNSITPTHSFRVFPPDNETVGLRPGEIACIVGKHIVFDPKELENFCFKLIDNVDCELIFLTAACAYADRAIRRLRSQGWMRSLRIIMPVKNPSQWDNPEVHSALIEVLEYLTGDKWEFEFVAMEGSWNRISQNILFLGSGKFVVIPFSDGLDSFAQSMLLKSDPANRTPIRVTKWSNNLKGSKDWISDELNGSRHRRVSIPVGIDLISHAEPTNRSRSFTFCVLAAVAYKLSGAEVILIPENGQGALGPSLVTFNNESPPRGSHPGFTHRLSYFLGKLWRLPIRFEHPQLWKTKGAVLMDLKKKQLLQGWDSTRSCSRDRRHSSINHKEVPCGVCSGCLLRRFAMFSAGLDDPVISYFWGDLRSPTLEGSIHSEASRSTTENDRDIAIHAVLPLHELALKADAPSNDPAILQLAFEVANENNEIAVSLVPQIRDLLTAHKIEWLSFIEHLGSSSWISKIISY